MAEVYPDKGTKGSSMTWALLVLAAVIALFVIIALVR